MKKLLLSLTVFASAFAANAQVDTLSAHCSPATTYSGLLDNVAPIDSGFIAGNNLYGDLAKMRLFDAANGVTGSGTISGVAFMTIFKAGTGSINVAVWPDNAGAPDYANPLASTTVQLSAIDTTFANTSFLADGNFYNHVAMFTSPVNIPAGNKFWAGIVLPTGGTSVFATGISTPANGTGDTHTGEIQNGGTFFTFDNGTTATWQLDASITVYPIVDFTLGLNENLISTSVYPNPASTELNIKTSEEITSVVITTTDGKTVATGNNSNINVASLNAGMYIYKVTTVSGKIGTGNFVKN